MAWLSSSRVVEIDREIDSLYEKIEAPRYPDTPILEIIKRCGLEIFKYDFGDDQRQVMGAIDFSGEKPTIYLNKYNHPNNQQFTIAHELGHYILGHREQNMRFRIDFESDIYPQDTEIRQQELEANYFAGALLMPADAIKKQLGRDNLNGEITADEIEKLKAHFGVSGLALKTRIDWLRRSGYGAGGI